MRLIDADKLYGIIKTECNPYGNPTIDFEEGKKMLDIIDKQPTAYDIDKVVDAASGPYRECEQNG